ncbi:Cobalt-zinc-cadmium resistance protein CzcB [Botrimarina colliarenosi]|uniref:Cobalt-zinc-cadmium resistance protein CzcB n=1 Tax=Botrimarina colliarenosi TaxID=2528001 RepID=A0A5C6AHC1_9BACT|nr:efflux RND transporter periplasmic adaptor subunit [Botrimarina colliarenosi]TWT99432.1 Cobalt-zinc-cadmium resistance protein CzcB [Botrimarina colliarenosi]
MKPLLLYVGLVFASVVVTAAAMTALRPAPVGADLSVESPPDTAAATPLHLHPAEREAAGIELTKIEAQLVQTTRTLPGRIVYDATKHVSIVAAEGGVVESVLVQPGDRVAAGQTLAVMRCPAVGMARSELMSRKAALALATNEYEWRLAVSDGVQTLLHLIEQGQPIEEIERRVEQQRIGTPGAALLTAYSEQLLAQRLSQSATGPGGSGVLSGRVVDERRSSAQQAAARMKAAGEQALFEASQSCVAAGSDVEAARRRVEVARQEVATLIGLPSGAGGESSSLSTDEDLSMLAIRSPLAGTIERREISASERAAKGTELFVVADTSHLWVEADIRGGDWALLCVSEADSVRVTTPATGDANWTARVNFIGRQIDPLSGSAPLVAELDNRDGLLRPGLFARIDVPTSPLTTALVAPDSAVIDLNGQPTVFVPVGEVFEPLPVEIGRRFGDLVEILSPLQAGQEIVGTGAFFLKSEQLLAGEE